MNEPIHSGFSPGDDAPVAWRIDDRLVPYPEAIAFMERRATEIRDGTAPETVWILEHPPLYTAGTSAVAEELLEPRRFPVYQTGRGGRYTYHGPGQRIAYVLLDLKKRDQDIRQFVCDLEEWVIRTLHGFNITAERRAGRVGLWVARGAPSNPAYKEDKIAAIGVRVRQWVTFHGLAINVEPDLSHFSGIVPCGIEAHGVTSMWDLGTTPTVPEVDTVLRQSFQDVFDRKTVNAA